MLSSHPTCPILLFVCRQPAFESWAVATLERLEAYTWVMAHVATIVPIGVWCKIQCPLLAVRLAEDLHVVCLGRGDICLCRLQVDAVQQSCCNLQHAVAWLES